MLRVLKKSPCGVLGRASEERERGEVRKGGMMAHQGIASNFSKIFSSILLLFSPFSSSINPPTLANSVLTAFPRVSSTSLVYSNDRVEERIKSTQWCSIT